MTIALSTQNFVDHPDHSLLDDMAPFGFTSLFLGPGLWPRTIKRIRKRERHVAALSIFVERPFGIRWNDDPLQKLPLLTTDRELRSRTMDQAMKTILFAAELGIERVVAPLLSIEDCPRKLLLDAARSVIEPLLDEADRRRVRLCVPFGRENPDRPNESIPTDKELLAIFSAFSGAPLSYWHRSKQREKLKKQTKKEEPKENRSQGGILLTTDLPFDLNSYNPLAVAAFAAQSKAPPKEAEVKEEEAPTWLPAIPEGFVAQCAGVEIEAQQREDFVGYETKELWVIL